MAPSLIHFSDSIIVIDIVIAGYVATMSVSVPSGAVRSLREFCSSHQAGF